MEYFTAKSRKNNKKFSNYGISSIVTILTVMCVMSFTILSYITSKYDYILTQKIAHKNTEYFEASCYANDRLERIDKILHKCYVNADSESDYYTDAFNELQQYSGIFYSNQKTKLSIQNSGGTSFYYQFTTNISNTRRLETIVYIKYPLNLSDTFYQLKGSYEKVEINEPIDDTLNVYTGD